MLIAGFDAGQTSTRCRISQWDGTSWKICGEGSGPGVSHLAATGGRERFLHAVRCSAANALGTSANRKLDAAVVGASGIKQGTRLQASACQLLAETLHYLHQTERFANLRCIHQNFPDGLFLHRSQTIDYLSSFAVVNLFYQCRP